MREERAAADVRAGHLLRIAGYLDLASLSMWTANPRAARLLGMAQASIRGRGPGGCDEDLLRRIRPLMEEAVYLYSRENFPAAMTRLRVVQDLVDLRTIEIAGG